MARLSNQRRRDRKRYLGKEPRQANQEEIMGWVNIATKRDDQPVRELDNQQRIAYLKAKNPVRLYRMMSDFRWAQKQFLKAGLDPEDVRWLYQ